MKTVMWVFHLRVQNRYYFNAVRPGKESNNLHKCFQCILLADILSELNI